MGYKILGFVVWKSAKWVVRQRVNSITTSRSLKAGVVVAGVGVAAVVVARRERA